MKSQTIAVIGTKKSGKTTTIENLTRELANRGYNVAVIKHICEPDFTIDTVGKDTWKFAEAGARTILTVATNEIATIEKISIEKLSLNSIVQKCANNQIIVIEGLKKLVARNKNIPKIIVAKTEQEAKKALDCYEPILAFSGPYNTNSLSIEIPYANAQKDTEKLADIVENELLK